MSDLQKALQYPPASAVATSVFNARTGSSTDAQVAAVAGFMKAIEGLGDCTLKVLTVINPAMIASRTAGHKPLNLPAMMPDTQADLVLQISAMNRRDCQFAQRLACDALAVHFELVAETTGGDVFLNQEPFGFYHEDPEEREKLAQVSEITSGDLKGGSWLLYQRWVQNLGSFYSQSHKDQLETVGGEPVRTDFWDSVPPNTPIPPDAHVKWLAQGDVPALIRRGFSYRKDGNEGVIFMATAADIDSGFNATLQKMASGDRLMGFAEAVEGGLYFVPPSGDWLDSSAPAASISPAAAELLVRQQDGAVLNMAEILVTQAFAELITELVGDVLFADHIDPQAKQLMQAINERAAGGTLASVSVTGANPGKTRQLNNLLDQSTADGARFNEIAGKYMVTT